MHPLSRRAAALLALTLALRVPAAAQIDPQPIPATHPNAVRAAAVVERILAGDRAGLVEVLRREGDPAFVAGPLEEAVDRVMNRLGPPAKWRISHFESAGIEGDVIVRLRDGEAAENVAVRMQAAPPHRITGFARAGAGSGAPAGPPPAALGAAAQRAVVDSIARSLERLHVAADTGRMIADHLRSRLREGAYAALTAPRDFADALTRDMQAINGDRHLNVRAGMPRAQGGGGAPDSRPSQGFAPVEILQGNVGYLRLSGPMEPTRAALAAATSAIRELARADAVILDLRGVPGGSPVMVDHLASHFVEPGTPLVRVYDRSAESTEVRRALNSVPGPRRLDVPLYVLVDPGSFSAAEALPFILQNLGRATIVGERTRGGGRNNRFIPVGYGLTASVTFTRVTDPKTGRGWEGVGIQPDVAVPAAEARDAAHRHALERLGRTGG